MKKKLVIMMAFMLFALPLLSSAEKISYIKKNDGETGLINQLDAPMFGNGDNWKYDIELESSLGDAMSFNWVFENVLFTVSSDSGSNYEFDIDGDVSGEINLFEIQLVSGSLRDTTITGTTTVEKSNIGIKEIDVVISGKIAVANIPLKSFTMDIDLTFSPSYNAVSYPLSVGKKWTVPLSDVTGSVDISLLNNPVLIDDIVGGDYCECTGIESITVPAGTYDAYKILSDEDVTERYYAEEVGNFVKAYGDVGNMIDIQLKSTNYGSSPGAPNKPSKPQGTSSGTPGNSYTYTSSTTDNEGDQIYYLFDWGDGKNSGWIGPYNSGESCSASNNWNSRGTYSVKVKAKDTEEHVSSWSDPLSVTMPKNKIHMTSKLNILLYKLFEEFPLINRLLNI